MTDKYLKEDEPKEEEAKPFELEIPFISDIGKMIEKGGKLIEKKNKKLVTTPRREKWTIERLRGIAKETAEKNCRTIYEVFKKERRMLAW